METCNFFIFSRRFDPINFGEGFSEESVVEEESSQEYSTVVEYSTIVAYVLKFLSTILFLEKPLVIDYPLSERSVRYLSGSSVRKWVEHKEKTYRFSIQKESASTLSESQFFALLVSNVKEKVEEKKLGESEKFKAVPLTFSTSSGEATPSIGESPPQRKFFDKDLLEMEGQLENDREVLQLNQEEDHLLVMREKEQQEVRLSALESPLQKSQNSQAYLNKNYEKPPGVSYLEDNLQLQNEVQVLVKDESDVEVLAEKINEAVSPIGQKQFFSLEMKAPLSSNMEELVEDVSHVWERHEEELQKEQVKPHFLGSPSIDPEGAQIPRSMSCKNLISLEALAKGDLVEPVFNSPSNIRNNDGENLQEEMDLESSFCIPNWVQPLMDKQVIDQQEIELEQRYRENTSFVKYVRDNCPGVSEGQAFQWVKTGKAKLKDIYGGEQIGEVCKEDVTAVVWALMYETVKSGKGGFTEGTFSLPDTNQRLFNFLWRAPGVHKRLSSHYKGDVDYHFGLDLEGLPASKRTIVFGMMNPSLHEGEYRIYLKPENHGVDTWLDFFLHAYEYVITRPEKIFGFEAKEGVRKEHLPRQEEEKFKRIYERLCLMDSEHYELNQQECYERVKVNGIAFIYLFLNACLQYKSSESRSLEEIDFQLFSEIVEYKDYLVDLCGGEAVEHAKGVEACFGEKWLERQVQYRGIQDLAASMFQGEEEQTYSQGAKEMNLQKVSEDEDLEIALFDQKAIMDLGEVDLRPESVKELKGYSYVGYKTYADYFKFLAGIYPKMSIVDEIVHPTIIPDEEQVIAAVKRARIRKVNGEELIFIPLSIENPWKGGYIESLLNAIGIPLAGGHAVMAIVNLTSGCIEYYDPQAGVGGLQEKRQLLHTQGLTVQRFLESLMEQTFINEEGKSVQIDRVENLESSHQRFPDKHNCAIFMMRAMMERMEGKTFGQIKEPIPEHIDVFRRYLIKILNGKGEIVEDEVTEEEEDLDGFFLVGERQLYTSTKRMRVLRAHEFKDRDDTTVDYEVGGRVIPIRKAFIKDLERANYYVKKDEKNFKKVEGERLEIHRMKVQQNFEDIFEFIGKDENMFIELTQLMYQKAFTSGLKQVYDACQKAFEYEDLEDMQQDIFPKCTKCEHRVTRGENDDVILTSNSEYDIMDLRSGVGRDYCLKNQIIYNLTQKTIEEKTWSESII